MERGHKTQFAEEGMQTKEAGETSRRIHKHQRSKSRSMALGRGSEAVGLHMPSSSSMHSTHTLINTQAGNLHRS